MSSLAGARWVWLALAVIAADRATKLVLQSATQPGFSRVIIPDFLDLVHVRNRGVAFSLFAENDATWLRPALIAFSLVAVLLFSWILHTDRAGKRAMRWGFALVLGGAAGNVIDRVVHGFVIDFLDFHVREWHWPAFNVADSAITIGAILIFWEMLLGHRGSAASAGRGAPSNQG